MAENEREDWEKWQEVVRKTGCLGLLLIILGLFLIGVGIVEAGRTWRTKTAPAIPQEFTSTGLLACIPEVESKYDHLTVGDVANVEVGRNCACQCECREDTP